MTIDVKSPTRHDGRASEGENEREYVRVFFCSGWSLGVFSASEGEHVGVFFCSDLELAFLTLTVR